MEDGERKQNRPLSLSYEKEDASTLVVAVQSTTEGLSQKVQMYKEWVDKAFETKNYTFKRQCIEKYMSAVLQNKSSQSFDENLIYGLSMFAKLLINDSLNLNSSPTISSDLSLFFDYIKNLPIDKKFNELVDGIILCFNDLEGWLIKKKKSNLVIKKEKLHGHMPFTIEKYLEMMQLNQSLQSSIEKTTFASRRLLIDDMVDLLKLLNPLRYQGAEVPFTHIRDAALIACYNFTKRAGINYEDLLSKLYTEEEMLDPQINYVSPYAKILHAIYLSQKAQDYSLKGQHRLDALACRKCRDLYRFVVGENLDPRNVFQTNRMFNLLGFMYWNATDLPAATRKEKAIKFFTLSMQIEPNMNAVKAIAQIHFFLKIGKRQPKHYGIF